MKTKILKKVRKRVKLRKGIDKSWHVLRRKGWNDWFDVYSSVLYEKALRRKHQIMMIILKDLGYRNELIERRRKKNKNKI